MEPTRSLSHSLSLSFSVEPSRPAFLRFLRNDDKNFINMPLRYIRLFVSKPLTLPLFLGFYPPYIVHTYIAHIYIYIVKYLIALSDCRLFVCASVVSSVSIGASSSTNISYCRPGPRPLCSPGNGKGSGHWADNHLSPSHIAGSNFY